MEIWKDVKGYEGYYQVSNTGEIKSVKRIVKRIDGKYNHIFEKILIGGKTPTGYIFHSLTINNFKKQEYIHRLVALHFIPNPENKKTVNHIDGDKSNNNEWNLEWNTPKENTLHGVKTGLIKKGQDCSYAKLNEKQVLEIRENKYKICQEYLGLIYGVEKSTISAIQTRKIWKHI